MQSYYQYIIAQVSARSVVILSSESHNFFGTPGSMYYYVQSLNLPMGDKQG